MMIAGYPTAERLLEAAAGLTRAGLSWTSRTPVALPGDEDAPSRIPRLVFAAAALVFAGAFGMQCYAAMVSYPQLVGGRPGFFWTSYLVWAIEAAVLAATITAVAAFLIANRLPRYWEPSDECDALRAATRDGWFLVAEDAAQPLLMQSAPDSLDHLPS